MSEQKENLLSVRDLKSWFPVKRGLLRRTVANIKAVDGISFDILPGKTFGLVGESGCGKTTAARTIARLIPAAGGQAIFDGEDILKASAKKLQRIRRDISIIFQDPYGSLNPRMTVGNIIAEPLKVHKIAAGSEIAARTADLLKKVGLSPDHINRYPHEFSGGQRQRVGIARGLALNPRLVICDEPVSALDVSIQSQILNLLKDLQDEFNLTYLFIAHDLAVVEFVSDIVAVMYLGRIVEIATAQELYQGPLHPYTKMLLSAIPQPEPKRKTNTTSIPGEMPSAANPPSGCPFHPRCPLAEEICSTKLPGLEQYNSGCGMHLAACWKCRK